MNSSLTPAAPPAATAARQGLASGTAQSCNGPQVFNDGIVVDCQLARLPHGQTLTSNSDVVAVTGARLHLSGATDFKLTSTPSVAAGTTVGQEVQIVNTGPGLITLQGRALSGSTLMLRSRTITLAPACSVTVVWDGSRWIEAHRATFGTSNEHHVEDFGAIGDSAAFGALGNDDTLAIQAAIDAASADGLPVVLTPGKLYRVTSELLVKGAVVHIQGGGKLVGGIRGTAPARAVVAVSDGTLRVSDLQIYADRIVDNGVYIEAATASIVERCHIYQPLSDGIRISFGSDSCRILDVQVELCGRTFATPRYAGNSPSNIKTTVAGTVSVANVTVGAETYPRVTGVGTGFLSMGIRRGDFIAVHAAGAGAATSEWLQIYDVISDTVINCLPPSTSGHAAGSDYSVHVGDGYHEGPGRADNNNHCIDGWVSRNIGGCGIHIHGLYGPKVSNAQCDASGAYPVAVATQGVVTIGAHFSKMYFELNNAADNFFLGYAGDIIIDQVNGKGRPVITNPSVVWGVIRGMQNATDPGRVDPLGSDPIDYVPSAVLADDSYLKGTLRGFGYAQNGPGTSSLRMKDNFSSAWLATSGIEPPQGGADPNAVAFDFDTATANIRPGPAKRLMRWRSGGVVKAALDFLGAFFSPCSDATASPGHITMDTPSGRAAIAMGASTVIITNACVSAADTVQVTALGRDAACRDLVVEAVNDGSFVVGGSATAAAATRFMFTVLKAL
jgi:hypothetical protein